MKHKIVELAYWSIDGTHFLATPNLVIGTSAPTATDHHGKKFNIVAFSKDWEQYVAQAKAQLHFFVGGKWATTQEIQADDSASYGAEFSTVNNVPQMALVQAHA